MLIPTIVGVDRVPGMHQTGTSTPGVTSLPKREVKVEVMEAKSSKRYREWFERDVNFHVTYFLAFLRILLLIAGSNF
jgi:hypothetical protein